MQFLSYTILAFLASVGVMSEGSQVEKRVNITPGAGPCSNPCVSSPGGRRCPEDGWNVLVIPTDVSQVNLNPAFNIKKWDVRDASSTVLFSGVVQSTGAVFLQTQGGEAKGNTYSYGLKTGNKTYWYQISGESRCVTKDGSFQGFASFRQATIAQNLR